MSNQHLPSHPEKNGVDATTTDEQNSTGDGETWILGHNESELKKDFHLWSTLGVQYSVTATPLAIGTYLSFVIGIGGSPVFFYGFIVCSIFNMCVCFSLAEIAAVYPHSSGQIYWAAALFPRKYARAASYACGWFASAAWFFFVAAAFLITSELLWALVQVFYPAFVTQPWHFYVLYLGTLLIGLLLNWPLFKIFPYMTKFLVVFINGGALFILIALLIRAYPKQSASFVFAQLTNYTGWSSNGVVFFLGLLPGMSAVSCFDSVTHLADEMSMPEKQIPQVMIGSAILSIVSGFCMILVYMFCIVNTENLLAPVGGQPVVQIMLDSLNSTALTTLGTLVFIITFIGGASCCLTTFSRVWWSFAREGGVPFSSFFAGISKRSQLPINTLIFCTFITMLVGAIELGSATALNAVLGGAVVILNISYALPIIALLINRRKGLPAKRYCNLGRFGPLMNIISVAWIAFMVVWLCIPLYLPVTGSTMNYASCIVVGVVLVSVVCWFCGARSSYTVPQHDS